MIIQSPKRAALCMWYISGTWMAMLTYKWTPGSKEGQRIGQISSVMSLDIAPRDMTWHASDRGRRRNSGEDRIYVVLWRIIWAETMVRFCCVYCCVVQATAIWIKVTRLKTVTFARTYFLEAPLSLLFSYRCTFEWEIYQCKPMNLFTNLICNHVLLDRTDRRGQDKMDWLPKERWSGKI